MSNKNNINLDKLNKNYGTKATLAQVFATIAQSFLLIGLGLELGISTIVIKDLYENPRSTFSLTLTQISWYGSILYIFHPTGSFLSGFLQERYGRKRCMIFANVPSIIGWILLYSTNSTFLLYTSTTFMGLGIGFSEAPILSYIGEITEPRLRGSMSSLGCTAAQFGLSLIFILGAMFDWRTVALLSALCPVTCICLIFFIPESPIWLVTKGKYEEAEKALCWLRGWVEPEVIKDEHIELIRYNEVSGTQNGQFNSTSDTSLLGKLSEFKDPLVYRPLRFLMIFFYIALIVGLLPCRPFFTKIMKEVNILDSNQNILLIVFAVLQYIGCLMVVFSVHHLGKRFLAMLSYWFSTVLILLFGIYIIAMKNDCISSITWIPTTLLCIIFFFSSCVTSLPWMLISEIFPNKSRGLASGTCAGLAYLLMFISTKLYITVELFLTLEYTMIFFGIIGLCGSMFLYYCLPETENKTLLEVEEMFALNSKSSNSDN